VHLIPAVPYAILMLAGSFSRLDPDLKRQARRWGFAAGSAAVCHVPAIAPGLGGGGGVRVFDFVEQYLMTVLYRVAGCAHASAGFGGVSARGDEAITRRFTGVSVSYAGGVCGCVAVFAL